MKIIGLGHYSRVGKDTLANMMMTELEARGLKVMKSSFAWKIKLIAHDLYGWAGLREPEFYDTPEGAPFRDIIIPALGKTPVKIWIEVGNLFRDVYPGTWLEYALQPKEGVDVLFVPDVRFDNEVAALKARDAYLLLVTREGVAPRDSISDQQLLGKKWYHEHVKNDEDQMALYRRACDIVDRLFP